MLPMVLRLFRGDFYNKKVLLMLLIWLLFMAILGFTSWSLKIINDKFLHFICFGIMSFLLFFTFKVNKKRNLVWSFVISFMILACFFSELLQWMITTRKFEFLDILANLLGSSVFLGLAYLVDTKIVQPKVRQQMDIQLMDNTWNNEAPGRNSYSNFLYRDSIDGSVDGDTYDPPFDPQSYEDYDEEFHQETPKTNNIQL
ncbi:hypothetical protein BB559_000044 [Furculomyces boomerangus]|uniref:VanZ-like domain-containing protein n=2 Tax=Harpellales TaxID=61421 RepID=A0A2T9Z6N1_9FUNG|nr:hypothetical protein BB559_000044 [Furculomyces boomerangus]PVZ98335.1 hypothetical protein BB558_005660 [Smittium angustum]